MSASITIYPRIGRRDSIETGVIDIPDIDANLYLAPSGDATWTKYTDNATTAQELVCEDAGYIECSFGGALARIPLMTAT